MLKVIIIETTKGEMESTTKGAIDENHKEIINDIQEELVNIENVKKQITKILKRHKLLSLSHLTWSQLIDLESSLEFQKHNNEPLKQLGQIENSAVMLKSDIRTNIAPGEYSNKLSSFAKKGTSDGTGFNIISHELLEKLNISVNSSFDEFIYSLKIANKTDILSNKVLSKIAKSYFSKLISNFENNNALTSTEKEHLSEFIVYLTSSSIISSDSDHPSLTKISEYLDSSNLVCGLNYVSFGSGQGYDLLIIAVEDGTRFRKITKFNPVELKWRTRNSRDWLIPSNIKRQMTSSFRESIKKLYTIDNLPVGAYKVSKKGDLEFIPNTGFSMYTTFGRGNDGITKLDKFNEQLSELARIWEKCNAGSVFPLHELVPNSNEKTLQESLINAVREQCFLEGLIENGFILDYKGDLSNYKQVEYCPKRSHSFKFNSNQGIISRTISNEDFKVFADDKPKFIEPFNLYLSKRTDETIIVDRYYSFNLSNDVDFINSLDLEPDDYRIFVSNSNKVKGFILTSDNKIVCTEKYYSKHKQDLIVEIKTRFANSIRDEKKLVKWNGIVTDDFTYETDLAFFTANPQQLSKTKNTYQFHPNLNKSKGEAHILGLDSVFYYTFRIGNTSKDAEMQNSEWFRTSYKKFTNRFLKTDEPIIIEDIFGDTDKYTKSYFEGYGEMPTRTFFADGSYSFKNKLIAQELINRNLEKYSSFSGPVFEINSLLRKNDVYDESYLLFSGDTRNKGHTVVDETFTVSKESGYRRIDRTNLIRADWIDTKTFVRKDSVPCFITLIKKLPNDKQSKKLFALKGQTDLYRLETNGKYLEYVIKRDQANYFVSIAKKEDNYTYFLFQKKARNEKTLEIIRNQLLDTPLLIEKGKSRINQMYSDWLKRLNKAKKLQTNPHIIICLNENESGWLLVKLGRNITKVNDDLFRKFKMWYVEEASTIQKQIWNESEYGELTKKNFYEIFSFGLIPKASFAGRTRTIYEVNSEEIQNFINIVSNKYMQIALYSDENPWLNWAGELAKELKKLII